MEQSLPACWVWLSNWIGCENIEINEDVVKKANRLLDIAYPNDTPCASYVYARARVLPNIPL